MNLDEYEYLWRDPGAGALIRLSRGEYMILDRRDDGLVIIEDDELAAAVKQEMLRHGVPIFTPEELRKEPRQVAPPDASEDNASGE